MYSWSPSGEPEFLIGCCCPQFRRWVKKHLFLLGARETLIVIPSVIWTLSFVKHGVLGPVKVCSFVVLMQGGQKLTAVAPGVCLLFLWHAALLWVLPSKNFWLLRICNDSEQVLCKKMGPGFLCSESSIIEIHIYTYINRLHIYQSQACFILP